MFADGVDGPLPREDEREFAVEADAKAAQRTQVRDA